MRLAFLPLVLLALPARADAPPAKGEAGTDVELAKAHFKTGEIYYDRGRYPDAAREFEEAYRLSRRSELLYNMGKSYDGAGDQARALTAYRRFLATVKVSPDKPAVEARVSVLSHLVGRVVIRTSVEGAAVEVDGEIVGQSPLPDPLELNPGSHRLVASREGYKTYRGQLDVGSGSEQTVEAKLDSLVQIKVVEVPRKETPVYKRWWLWTVVGVVVAGGVIAGGVLGAQKANEINGPHLTLPKVQ